MSDLQRMYLQISRKNPKVYTTKKREGGEKGERKIISIYFKVKMIVKSQKKFTQNA